MCEKLQPIVGLEENKKKEKYKTYSCPMCGEYLRRPTLKWLMQHKKEPYHTCRYCLTKVDWSFLLNESK